MAKLVAENVTENIAKYVDDVAVNLSELFRKSGVEYAVVYASLGRRGKGRELKANELMSICTVLKINPTDFADTLKEKATG